MRRAPVSLLVAGLLIASALYAPPAEAAGLSSIPAVIGGYFSSIYNFLFGSPASRSTAEQRQPDLLPTSKQLNNTGASASPESGAISTTTVINKTVYIPTTASPALAVSGMTPAELAARLAALEAEISSLRSASGIAGEGGSSGLTSAFVTSDFLSKQTGAIFDGMGSSLSNYLPFTGGTLTGAISVNGVSGLAASDIPDLSASYLPLAGGTVTGNLTVSGALSSSALSFSNASTTLLSVTGPAYFGGTATSSFATDGSLTLAKALGVMSGGTGLSIVPSYGQLLLGNALDGYTLTATSSLGIGRIPISSSPYSYWVTSGGSDSNDCRTFATGCATLQHAVDLALSQLDAVSGGAVENSADISLQSGAIFYQSVKISGKIPGNGYVTIHGNGGTATLSSGDANTITAQFGAQIYIKNLTLTSTGGGYCLGALEASYIGIESGVTFAACGGLQIDSQTNSLIQALSGYTISGGAIGHLHAHEGGVIIMDNMTIACSGSFAFSAYFAGASFGRINAIGTTFSGCSGITGPRFTANRNASIRTNTDNLDLFPGSSRGTVGQNATYDSYGTGGYSQRQITSGSADTANTGDSIILWNSDSAVPKTEILPACSSTTGPWQTFTIKDQYGDADTNEITVSAAGGKIDGMSNYIIGATHDQATFFCNGADYSVLGDSHYQTIFDGLYSTASTTIGNGSQSGGLYINGGATTTLNAYFGGSLGIGKQPAQALDVVGAIAISGTPRITNNGSLQAALGSASSPSISFSANSTTGFYTTSSGSKDINVTVGGVVSATFASTGNIGIGTTSPDVLLTVGGATSIGTVAHFENSTGSCYINPTSGVSCSSDARLKTNVADLNASTTLSGILSLKPVTFNWRADNATRSPHAGFIAQQVRPIFPDLVSQGPDGSYALNYAGFAPYLVKAIQEIASVSGAFRDNFIAWLGDAGNGINDFFAKAIHADIVYVRAVSSDTVTVNQQLCVGSTCVTPAQFQAMVTAAGQGRAASTPTATTSVPDASTTPAASSTPPSNATTTPDAAAPAPTSDQATSTADQAAPADAPTTNSSDPSTTDSTPAADTSSSASGADSAASDTSTPAPSGDNPAAD